MDLDRIPNKKLKVIINIWTEGREYHSLKPITWNILKQGAGFTPSVKVLEPWKTEICVFVLVVSHVQLSNFMDYNPPGSSAHGIPLARNWSGLPHSLLQEIFLTQGLNPCLLYCRQAGFFIIWGSREAQYQTRDLCTQFPFQDLRPYVPSPHLSLVSNSGSETICNNLSEVACDGLQTIFGLLEWRAECTITLWKIGMVLVSVLTWNCMERTRGQKPRWDAVTNGYVWLQGLLCGCTAFTWIHNYNWCYRRTEHGCLCLLHRT